MEGATLSVVIQKVEYFSNTLFDKTTTEVNLKISIEHSYETLYRVKLGKPNLNESYLL